MRMHDVMWSQWNVSVLLPWECLLFCQQNLQIFTQSFPGSAWFNYVIYKP